MNANIIELFQSIQGEGKFTGVKQVFVRFFECNMHCHWCDTPHSIGDSSRNYREMTLDEVFQQTLDLWPGSHSISLTGGEPLLQADFIKQLAERYKESDMSVHVETNGTLPEALQKVIHTIDVVAMDLKLPSSTQCRSYWEEHREFLKIAHEKDVFIKTVITCDTKEEDIVDAVNVAADINPDILFIIQPNTFDLGRGIMKVCNDFEIICSKRLNNVRILPQMHKMMKVR